ncbi:MAG: histidine kinase [Oscillospiraceae bacterium]|jgi:sensor histidine kinase YesM|nr:histidine kinase [Oscillospiraceae bacterium]
MRKSLAGILVTSFAIVMVLLITVILGSYFMTVWQAEQSAATDMENALNDTAANLQDMLLEVINGGNVVAGHQDVYNFMRGDEAIRLTLRDNVRQLLTSYVYFENGAVNAYLITADGARISAAPESLESGGATAFNVSHRVQADQDLQTPFRQPRLSECYEVRGSTYYALSTPIYPDMAAPATDAYVGALILVLRTDALAAAIPDSAAGGLMVTTGDRPLTPANDDLAARWRSGQRAELLYRQVPLSGWHVVAAKPDVGQSPVVRQMRELSILLGVSALLLLSVLMVVQYRSIVGPIVHIAHQMDGINQQDGGVINPSRGRHELNQLTNSLNAMLKRFRQLNEEMVRVRLQVYEEHIIFLQAQINPHFLYNGFESIRGMAGAGNAAAIREMASDMAAIYRYCCKEQTLAPLQEELACLERYISILRLRHGERYQVVIDAEATALSCSVPRMILQPLVENAVQHGFIDAGRKAGHVNVRAAKEGDALLLAISDDGAGMEETQMSRFNRGTSAQNEQSNPTQDEGAHSHIGITNVLRRIRLLYGVGARVRFVQSAVGGLCIQMRLEPMPEKRTTEAES